MPVHATSLKLPTKLKTRVDAAARAAGTTAHAFMMGAIERETRRAELYEAFLDEARAADREFERSGVYYDPDDVFDFLTARGTGKPARRPKPKKWRK